MDENAPRVEQGSSAMQPESAAELTNSGPSLQQFNQPGLPTQVFFGPLEKPIEHAES